MKTEAIPGFSQIFKMERYEIMVHNIWLFIIVVKLCILDIYGEPRLVFV